MDLEDELRKSFESLWDFIEDSHRIAALGRWIEDEDVQPDFIVEQK